LIGLSARRPTPTIFGGKQRHTPRAFCSSFHLIAKEQGVLPIVRQFGLD
jgi:hypothetical protein